MPGSNLILFEATFVPEAIQMTLPAILDALEGFESMDLFTSTACAALLPIAAQRTDIRVHAFDHYFSNPEVELQALTVAQSKRISHVLALREFDLLRAARVREQAGLSGMSAHTAEGFRDKLFMKERARAAKVRTPNFMSADNATELAMAASQFGYPLIVKPRRKAGGVGFKVLHAPVDLVNLCQAAASELDWDQGLDLIAEEFMTGRMFHADGIWNGSDFQFFFANEYVGLKQHHAFNPEVDQYPLSGSLNLPPYDPVWAPLRDFARQTLTVLGEGAIFAFHIEIWETPAGFSLNEAASRTGGGQVFELLWRLFGSSPDACHLRALLGNLPSQSQIEPVEYTLVARIPRRAGVFHGLPDSEIAELQWKLFTQPGSEVPAPATWVDTIGYIFCRGQTRDAVTTLYWQAREQIHAAIVA